MADEISLSDAFDNVMMPVGAAQSLLQWIGQQVGHDTEAGRALNEGGASLTAPEAPVSRSTTTASGSTTKTS